MAREKGYVTTLWGRKRRLPDMQLEPYEFDFSNFVIDDFDPLSFNDDNTENLIGNEKQKAIQYYTKQLDKAYGRVAKEQVKAKAKEDRIIIKDNGGFIAQAERQCVNSRIQGSAADMSKKAMILVGNNKRLKELGFRLLIPVHDELIGECPIENAVECKKLFAQLISYAAKDRLEVPISCDVEVTKSWYGDTIELEE